VDLPPGSGRNGAGEHLAQTVADHASASLRRLDYADDTVHATFFVDCPNDRKLFDMVAAVRERFPGAGVSLIDQTHTVEG
jgi:hypothetical protein